MRLTHRLAREHGGTLFATLAPRVYPATFFLYHWKKLPFEPPPLIRAKPKSALPRLGRNFSSSSIFRRLVLGSENPQLF